MRISDWSSDVCSSDLGEVRAAQLLGNTEHQPRAQARGESFPAPLRARAAEKEEQRHPRVARTGVAGGKAVPVRHVRGQGGEQVVVAARAAERSEEHTSELQSLMRTSYAVLCLQKKTN